MSVALQREPIPGPAGVELCIDGMPAQSVWMATQIPGVKTWLSGLDMHWMFVPYNATDIVSECLGVQLHRFQPVAAEPAYPPVPEAWTRCHSFMRSYQRKVDDHFNTLRCRRRLLLGDAMGLGKTLEAIGCMAGVVGPKLILGPRYLRATWQDELSKWLPGEKLHIIETANPSAHHAQYLPAPADVEWMFCHYDILWAWWSWLRMYRFQGVVVDEAHMLKNLNTKRGKGVALAVGSIPARIIMTGTPMENRTAELHQLLELVSGRGTWGTRSEFRIRYAGAKPNAYGGLVDGRSTNTEELQQRMKHHYLRRTPAEVRDLDLPPVQRIPKRVDITSDDAERIAKVMGDPAVAHAMHFFQQTGELPSGKEALGAVSRLRKAISRAKVKASLEVIEAHMASRAEDPLGAQIVVFTWERAVAKSIAQKVQASLWHKGAWQSSPEDDRARLRSTFVETVTGDMSQTLRDDFVQRFRQHAAAGKSAVLVATYGALGTGVNLQCADAVVMHDIEWVPGVLLQAEARVWRGGQMRPVSSYWMVGAGTFDEYIMGALLRKADEISTIGDMEPQQLRAAFGAFGHADPFEDYAKRLTAWQEAML